MKTQTLRIPQLGEGLHEVSVIRLLKQVGEAVQRDEPIYQVETDKALVDVEASCSGTLARWHCQEGDVLGIDAPIADISVAETAGRGGFGARNGSAPALDAYSLKTRPSWRGEAAGVTTPLANGDTPVKHSNGFKKQAPIAAAPGEEPAETSTLSSRQQALIRRMSRQTHAIPATIHSSIDWAAYKATAHAMEARLGAGMLTDFEFLALAVSRSVKKHPAFRSRLLGDEVQVYEHLNLGLAVALRSGELTVAVVKEADRLSPAEFVAALRESVKQARHGVDQVGPVMQLQLSHLGTLGVHSATPVLVPPAVATLFLGSPSGKGAGATAMLSLTFDHRLINGVGAAMYLRDVVRLACGRRAIEPD